MALDLMNGELLTILAGMMVITIFVSIGLYIYMGLAYMALGKKAKLKTPSLSWIPGIGPLILAFQASKMHWWPWLLLIGMFIPVLNFIASPVFTVFAIIWHWKMFEAVGRPGWWGVMLLIPIVGLVLVGIAAWSKK